MIRGLNHLTLSVRDLGRSLDFYADLLEMKRRAVWNTGAYLSAGDLWLCLTLDARTRAAPLLEYTHAAFHVSERELLRLQEKLLVAGVSPWQDNRSEGASFYFLDPDGHKLELHAGDLASRLRACRASPYAGMRFFDESAPGSAASPVRMESAQRARQRRHQRRKLFPKG
jgi:catechol 2,3-dioxygenase-like lactoylglutathione lyase family enzyme